MPFKCEVIECMEKIRIEGKTGSSIILVGEVLENLSSLIPQSNVFLLTDTNVHRFHGDKFPDYPVFIIDPGEKSKDFPVVAKIFDWLLNQGADRKSFVVGIGGGVVCDIAGFVASTFMRGIPFGFVATSLLAQVDASVGGKNGINLHGYKNIIGTFTQPQFVICDTSLLHTLPEEEFRNGLAEVIKHALIRDQEKFLFLTQQKERILRRDTDAVNHLVSKSVHIKADIVQADELEQGERRLLNFGHTWGHAVEKVTGIPHGQAVSVGMAFATSLSVHLGFISENDQQAIRNQILEYGLPLQVPIDKQLVLSAMLKDKKRISKSLHYVLLKGIGSAFVKEIDVEDFEKYSL